jgi:hypothetical protein
MNSLYELMLSIGDDSILIKDTSLTLLKFSIVPLIFSLIKIKKIKKIKIASIEGFWVLLFVTNLIQLFITSFIQMSDFSYCIVSSSAALIFIHLFKGYQYEN